MSKRKLDNEEQKFLSKISQEIGSIGQIVIADEIEAFSYDWNQLANKMKEVTQLFNIIKNKMENPKIKTKIIHSQTKSAWNIVSENLGSKYKIARIPYLVLDNQELSDRNRIEALKHAEFISHCYNHADSICAVK
jgi:adenine-specific DNA methylase